MGAKTTTAPWKPQQSKIKYGLSEAQRLYDVTREGGGPQYYQGKTLAGFTPAEKKAQRAIYGYAMGPESQALQAGATANLGNVYKLGQGLPGLGQAYAQPAQRIAQGLPGLGEQYAGSAMGYAGDAGDIASGMQRNMATYTAPAANIASKMPGIGVQYAQGAGNLSREAMENRRRAMGTEADITGYAMGGMGYGDAMAQPLSQSGYSQLTPFQSDQYQKLLSGEVDTAHLTPVIEAMGRDVQGQLDPILASLRQGTISNQPGGGTRGDLAAGTATAGLMQGMQDQAARMYADAYKGAQDRRLSAAQLGIGQQQFGMGHGLQAGQLGLGAGQLGLQAGGLAKDLGAQKLAAGDLIRRSYESGGQLGLSAGGLSQQAAQQAGQLGLGAGGLATQAGRLSTDAARAGGELGLGAGNLATKSAQMGGQLGLGALDRYQGIMDQPLKMYGAAGKVGEQQRSMQQEKINRAMAKHNFEQNAAQNNLNQYLSQVGSPYGSANTQQAGGMNNMANMLMMYNMFK